MEEISVLKRKIEDLIADIIFLDKRISRLERLQRIGEKDEESNKIINDCFNSRQDKYKKVLSLKEDLISIIEKDFKKLNQDDKVNLNLILKELEKIYDTKIFIMQLNQIIKLNKYQKKKGENIMNWLEKTDKYGNIPDNGGFGTSTEYEIGIGLIIEELHCIIGSIKKELTSQSSVEKDHISEELKLIKANIERYKEPYYESEISADNKYSARSREYLIANSKVLLDKMYENIHLLEKDVTLNISYRTLIQFIYQFIIEICNWVLRYENRLFKNIFYTEYDNLNKRTETLEKYLDERNITQKQEDIYKLKSNILFYDEIHLNEDGVLTKVFSIDNLYAYKDTSRPPMYLIAIKETSNGIDPSIYKAFVLWNDIDTAYREDIDLIGVPYLIEIDLKEIGEMIPTEPLSRDWIDKIRDVSIDYKERQYLRQRLEDSDSDNKIPEDIDDYYDQSLKFEGFPLLDNPYKYEPITTSDRSVTYQLIPNTSKWIDFEVSDLLTEKFIHDGKTLQSLYLGVENISKTQKEAIVENLQKYGYMVYFIENKGKIWIFLEEARLLQEYRWNWDLRFPNGKWTISEIKEKFPKAHTSEMKKLRKKNDLLLKLLEFF